MDKNLDYESAPYNFSLCIRTQCLQAQNCLRYKAFANSSSENENIMILNPARLPGGDTPCKYYYPDQKVRFAVGITHLLDNIPHTKAIEIKRELVRYLKKNTYYRILNKERTIKPAEQEFIRQLFIKKGIKDEPVFDGYREQYLW